MVNNRTIISWETVLQAKQKYEIKNMLIENYKAFYGSDINVDVETADAGWIDALTDILYDFSLVAVNTYNSLDINNARGALLDNLVLLSGNLVRKTALKTLVQTQISFGDSNTLDIDYTPGVTTLSAYDVENKRWIISPVDETDTIIFKTGVYPMDYAVEAKRGLDQLVYLEHSYDGDFLLPPSGSTQIVELRKDGAFVTNKNILLSNSIIIQRGSSAETDSQLKARKKESLSYNSTSLVDSIREKILGSIYSIKDVRIYSSVGATALQIDLWNGTDLLENITIPLHDIFVLIKPEEGVTIREAGAISSALVDILQKKITLGISTFQDADGTYFGDDELDLNYDANYHSIVKPVNSDQKYITYTETYRYYISQPFMPFMAFKYTPIANSGFNLDRTKERIIRAVYAYAKEYTIDKDINRAELMSVAYNAANIDVLNPTCRIDSIDISIDTPPTAGDNDIFVNNGYWYVNLENELTETNNKLTFVQTV